MARQIYFNPSCSKCRSALSLLDEHGIEADVVRYLDHPPTRAELERLMHLLGIEDPRLMMRTGESVYVELGLAVRSGDDLLEAITTHPILLERPVFVAGDRAGDRPAARAGPRPSLTRPSPDAPGGPHLGCAHPARTSRGGRG